MTRATALRDLYRYRGRVSLSWTLPLFLFVSIRFEARENKSHRLACSNRIASSNDTRKSRSARSLIRECTPCVTCACLAGAIMVCAHLSCATIVLTGFHHLRCALAASVVCVVVVVGMWCASCNVSPCSGSTAKDVAFVRARSNIHLASDIVCTECALLIIVRSGSDWMGGCAAAVQIGISNI